MLGKQGVLYSKTPSDSLVSPLSNNNRSDDSALRRMAAGMPSSGSKIHVNLAQIPLFADEVDIARYGTTSSHQALPHLRTLQPLFGRHDLHSVQAVVGGNAAVASRSLGATAYAQGERVGFARSPDLFEAAHEAAHVIQQRSKRVPAGYRGQPSDPHEQQADAIADRAVRGQSVEPILDPPGSRSAPVRSAHSSSPALQLKIASGQDELEIPEDDPYWRRLLASKGAGQIGQAMAVLGLRDDLAAIAEFERGFAAGKKPAELRGLTGGLVLATKTLFEVELGEVIMANLSLFEAPVRRVTAWISSYLGELAQQLAARIASLEALPVDPSLSDDSLLSSIDRAIEIKKLKAMQSLVEKLASEIQTAKSLKSLREVHYRFADKLFTADDELTQGMRQGVTSRLAGAAAVTTGQVRAKVPLVAGGTSDAFGRRSRAGNTLSGPEPERSADAGATRWNVFYFNPEKQKPSVLTGKLTSPARLRRDKSGHLLEPNLFLWHQLTRYMMPVSAGVSGTMADMIALGRTAGLSDSELWEYTMPQMGAMLAERHHSFHEIATVMAANLSSVTYGPGNYLGPIHPKIKQTAAYYMLQVKYPHILFAARR